MRRSTRLLVALLSLLLSSATAIEALGQDVYFRASDGRWQTLPARRDLARGTVSFTLDPARLRSGATLVVLDRPAGVTLDDEQPPLVTGLKLDGRPCRDASRLDLDWLPAHPTRLLLGFADRENPLDETSLSVRLNGREVPRDQALFTFTDAAHRNARLTLSPAALLPAEAPLLTTLEVRLADRSPQRNSISRTLTYRCLGRVTGAPALFTDTCCPGYEDLTVLTDGKVMTPGQTTYGCTWASEEQPGDHWLVLAWPSDRPQTIGGVEISWASFQGIFWAPRRLLVQIWDGAGWVTQKTVENLPATAVSTVQFTPVQTTRLRLFQPDGQGHIARPNIMWLTEVKVLPGE